MLALGLAALAGGVLIGSDVSRRKARLMSWAFALVTLGLVALSGLYPTAAPAVLRRTPPEAIDGVRRALFEDSVPLVAYLALFAAVAYNFWCRTRRSA